MIGTPAAGRSSQAAGFPHLTSWEEGPAARHFFHRHYAPQSELEDALDELKAVLCDVKRALGDDDQERERPRLTLVEDE